MSNYEIYNSFLNLKKYINSTNKKGELYSSTPCLYWLNTISKKNVKNVYKENIYHISEIIKECRNSNDINDFILTNINEEYHKQILFPTNIDIKIISKLYNEILKLPEHDPIFFILFFINEIHNIGELMFFINLKGHTNIHCISDIFNKYNSLICDNHQIEFDKNDTIYKKICPNKDIISKTLYYEYKKVHIRDNNEINIFKRKHSIVEKFFDQFINNIINMDSYDSFVFYFPIEKIYSIQDIIRSIKDIHVKKIDLIKEKNEYILIEFSKEECLEIDVSVYDIDCDMKIILNHNNNVNKELLYKPKFLHTELFNKPIEIVVDAINNLNRNNSLSHVALIPDGNGRFGKKYFNSRTPGHFLGAKNVGNLLKLIIKCNIKYFTIFATSKQNGKRGGETKKIYNDVFKRFFIEYDDFLKRNSVRVIIRGDMNELEPDFVNIVKKVEFDTRNNNKLVFIICVNYDAHDEIFDASKKNFNSTEELNEIVSQRIPDPELFIRTGKHQRISNFILWNLKYTDLYFIDRLIPEFTYDNLLDALTFYFNQTRNFGLITE
jgi:undecaprenyl diphosphate synthase